MSTPPTGDDPRTPPQHPGYGPQPQYASQPAYGPQPPHEQARYGQAPYGQAPYGQPAYGQHGHPAPWQPAPPPDRRRKRLVLALEAVALAIVVGVATLVYVLSATILDRAAVERDVAAQFEEREGVGLDLACDERMIVRPGADYECEGTTADGEDVEILISVTDDEGSYTWAED
jgi:hypothetical protein